MTDDATFHGRIELVLPHLRAYARVLCQQVEAADDLVREALIAAWAARDDFGEGTNFQAWTLAILRNRFLAQRRLQRRPPVADDKVVPFDAVTRVFWRLDPHQREIIMTAGAGGHGYDAAATVLGFTPRAARRRLWQARLHLQALLHEPSASGRFIADTVVVPQERN